METIFDSPLGNIKITSANSSVTAIEFTTDQETTEIPNPILALAKKELQEYFAHEREQFTFPVQMEGTEFQQKVWSELQKIPFGRTLSYLQMAVNLGDVKNIRAAASANGKNPIAIVVPCHRVIGSNGDLVGYAGGLDKKKWLLQHEGVINQLDIF